MRTGVAPPRVTGRMEIMRRTGAALTALRAHSVGISPSGTGRSRGRSSRSDRHRRAWRLPPVDDERLRLRRIVELQPLRIRGRSYRGWGRYLCNRHVRIHLEHTISGHGPLPGKDDRLGGHRPAELFLDPENPRLAGESFSVDAQDDILRWLWRNKSVNELVDSILANGFWGHEELFATEEGDRWVVVEGNRRLAAVKILLDVDLRQRLGIQLPETPSAEVLESIQ